MKSLSFPRILLSPEQEDALYKLLLNSWSAEYALRITPPQDNDERYINQTLYWALPQAYYAVTFGVRASLLASGIRMYSEDSIHRAIGFMASCGFYHNVGDTHAYDVNPIDELIRYRTPKESFHLSKAEIIPVHQMLREKANSLAGFHESHIRQTVGELVYLRFLSRRPAHLAFVADREALLQPAQSY